ncbi:hypothetical protein B5E41_30315 [Rhizobium esperanzae]|uniref:Uncharacterized protein n=1 Tax=Rhizobium esperanzae TaxID=1967781 RepID=A0A246DKP3_9HYPH|nr:hypothetical protein [Rhizobium esperanzae]OWO89539.1 hypothetical protein B5E41_30315 [Rhizobium esperanzae]
METAIINKIDLAAVAAQVQAEFAAMLERMGGLLETAKAVQIEQNAANEIRNNYEEKTVEEYREQLVADADFDLSNPLIWAIEKVAQTINQEVEKVGRGVADRSKQLSKVDEYIARELDLRNVRANIKAAETIERIESDFYLIEAKIETEGKGKYKSHAAQLMFLLNGTVYALRIGFNPKTSKVEEYQFRRFLDRKASTPEKPVWVELFTADMTQEQVAKAAHALDSIRAAFDNLLNPPVTEAAAA